jgi:hypothetical protein
MLKTAAFFEDGGDIPYTVVLDCGGIHPIPGEGLPG